MAFITCLAISCAAGGEKLCKSLICGKWETRSEVNRMHFGEDRGKIRGEGKEMGMIKRGGEQKKISLASSALM